MLVALNKKYKLFFNFKHFVAKVFCKVFFLDSANKWSILVASRFSNLYLKVKVPSGRVFNLIANTDLLYYRAATFGNKEPETNLWVSGIPKDGVFYDVGANVGIFSVMAAAFCKKVYAFEPVAINYSVLNQNLLINGLDKNVTAYCLAVSDNSGFDTMRLSSGIIGSAHHTFGRNIDACHTEFSPQFYQGALAVTLDELVYKYNFECPTYLKVDVDGNEQLVISGGMKLLEDTRLRSILVEINKNLEVDRNLVKLIESKGFELRVSGEESEILGMKFGNLIFYRK